MFQKSVFRGRTGNIWEMKCWKILLQWLNILLLIVKENTNSDVNKEGENRRGKNKQITFKKFFSKPQQLPPVSESDIYLSNNHL